MLIQPRLSDVAGREFPDDYSTPAVGPLYFLNAVFHQSSGERVHVCRLLREGSGFMSAPASRVQIRNLLSTRSRGMDARRVGRRTPTSGGQSAPDDHS